MDSGDIIAQSAAASNMSLQEVKNATQRIASMASEIQQRGRLKEKLEDVIDELRRKNLIDEACF